MCDDLRLGGETPPGLAIQYVLTYCVLALHNLDELAFRQTVAEYGVDLTWTPMILAKEFNRSVLARDSDFTTCSSPPPTILQFGANSPQELARATKLIAPYVNGVDINCGCPQSWACAETLGAALMHKRELVADMVIAAKAALKEEGYEGKKTVSVKIRVHKDLRQTADFIKTVEAAGADFITIHGRTRSTPSSHPVSLTSIQTMASLTTVPTLANGDVFTLSSAQSITEETGVDGVMAARGLLENPALFSGEDRCPWEAVEKFMNFVVRAPIPFRLVLHHVTEMAGSDRSQRGRTLLTKEERMRLVAVNSIIELIDLLDEVKGMRRL
ncbi:hypothetical protein BP5796_00134 [Coleophoma crateriformis]|uniref:tRNA-dihydrouridine synthase n=1 Tax=Coleophoma crateriformis TaxID=565419 RepID=A0A3D8T7F3_9HELO|nr:hypothetical protein BP5796_00134 [Coleophoma crateriformis]